MGAPKYSSGRARFKRWADAKRYYESQNIIVDPGKGRYPKCLNEKPYPEICPKEIPKDPKNIPNECKLCPECLESSFYAKTFHKEKIKRIKESGLPTRIEM